MFSGRFRGTDIILWCKSPFKPDRIQTASAFVNESPKFWGFVHSSSNAFRRVLAIIPLKVAIVVHLLLFS